MPDIINVMATADDDGHRCFPGALLTFCGMPVAAAVSVGLRRRAHRERPCPDCYDPAVVLANAEALTKTVETIVARRPPDLPPVVPRAVPTVVAYPPSTDPDHPLRSVWDLCERLDEAHAVAVRPRLQEAP